LIAILEVEVVDVETRETRYLPGDRHRAGSRVFGIAVLTLTWWVTARRGTRR
jgi:hypothetical protein